MIKLHSLGILVFVGALLATAAQANSTNSSPTIAAMATAADGFYMMCKRDGAMGKPGEPLACMQTSKKDENTVCSGSGASQICESSYYSLCKSVGAAAGKPMNDQAGKGSFADAPSCMAKCSSEAETWGRFGGTCMGDITPK